MISNTHLDSWIVQQAIFRNVTFDNVTFNDVVIKNSLFSDDCVFQTSVVKNSKFVQLNWDDISVDSLSVSSSSICDLQGSNISTSMKVHDTSINGRWYDDADITDPSELVVEPDANSTCSKEELDSTINCEQLDSFAVYRDSFFISASALPGNVASAIAVYFFRRNYWLGN